MPIIPLNSKEKNNLNKTIDKSQGKGIDSVKYNVVPDASSPVTKGASIPFDPNDLPDPAFDTHDLEMFHQEVYNTDDPYATSNMSLLIDPRSDDFGDYSGPNLDDHLVSYRSHDSGHMGLSESPADSAIGKTAEEKTESEQQLLEKEPNVPRVKEAYDEVVLKKDDKPKPKSSALFQIGEHISIDSQPPTIYSQSTHQTAPPVPQPRSFSGKEEKQLSRHPSESSIPTVTLSGAERACPPIPRPRSENNLLSMKGSQGLGTPPSSPSRSKPSIVPRMDRPRYIESGSNVQTAANRNVSAEAENAAATATCVSQQLPQINESLTIDDGATASTSHVTSMESNSSDNNVHSEAHTSLDSGSPYPSLESKPSISDKPDPCSSTPPERAHSAYSGEKKLVDVESSLDPEWINVHMIVDKKDGKDGLSSLDSQPRPRERAKKDDKDGLSSLDTQPRPRERAKKDGKDDLSSLDTQPRSRERAAAFSTNSDKTVSDKLQKPRPSKSTPREKTYIDIQSATPCWYCTNLTTLEICDVCGNEQYKVTAV
jgi:hypothetical protein